MSSNPAYVLSNMRLLSLFITLLCVQHIEGVSMSEFKEFLNTESVIIDNLKDYITKLESKIHTINRQKIHIEEVLRSAEEDVEKYLNNPINTFLMIKRFTSDWITLGQYACEDITKSVLENITQLDEVLKYPIDTDLDESVANLLKIQDVYRFDTSHIALGEFNGVKFGSSSMTWNDCYELGRRSYRIGDFESSTNWLETAIERLLLSNGEEDDKKSKLKIKIQETLMQSYLKSGTFDEARILANDILKLVPGHKTALKIKSSKLKNSKTKTKTKMHENVELELFKEICRGNDYSGIYHLNKPMLCYYKDNGKNFLRFGPFKSEEVNSDPEMFIYHDIVSDNESESLRRLLALNEIQNESDAELRTNDTIDLQFEFILAQIEQRITDLTGFEQRYFGEWQFAKNADNDDNDYVFHSNAAIQAVVLVFLTDVKLGGAIVFPQIDIKITPKSGSAVVWFNTNVKGIIDYRTRHRNCPIITGNKLVASLPIYHSVKFS